jgi:hypothetical protein
MGDLVNLRRARKARGRMEAQKKAQENRVAFGRTRAQREVGEAENELARRRLEAHRLGEADKPET